jgi:hypothetical protein
METEVKKNADGSKIEHVRHWQDKEIKEMHHASGKTWRSNRDKLRVIPVTDTFRANYDDVFRKDRPHVCNEDMGDSVSDDSDVPKMKQRRVKRKRRGG